MLHLFPVKRSHFALFLCSALLLVSCSSLEGRQKDVSEWWHGFFGTGSGMVQNLKEVYQIAAQHFRATVQVGKGAFDGLRSAAEDVQERVQKVQEGVGKIEEGKNLIEEGVSGKKEDP